MAKIMINYLLFMFESPLHWLIVIAAVSLLFGANKLPELAKSLGQAKNEFKKGMLEAEQEEKIEVKQESNLAQLNDDEILAEIQHRQAKQLEK